ncbi:MAG: hypothetical protein JST12_14580 [Armatimonadetes bacterium]|nr:hypothetical protein [Armatimonadota bacterium]
MEPTFNFKPWIPPVKVEVPTIRLSCQPGAKTWTAHPNRASIKAIGAGKGILYGFDPETKAAAIFVAAKKSDGIAEAPGHPGQALKHFGDAMVAASMPAGLYRLDVHEKDGATTIGFRVHERIGD